MQAPQVISLFCDDIRQEKRGTDILVGIYPDNLNVPSFPFTLPKLAIYTRIHFDPTSELGKITIFLRHDSGDELVLTELDPQLIQKTKADALAKEAPLAGLISRTVFTTFHIKEAGRTRVMVKINDQEYLSATLNVQQTPAETTSAIADEPPS